MLTFQWKYKKLKQIEVIKGSLNAWDIFTRLDPRLSLVINIDTVSKTLKIAFSSI